MQKPFFHPVSGGDLPRFAGVATCMRLPHVLPGHARFGDVDVGLTPFDSMEWITRFYMQVMDAGILPLTLAGII